MGVRTSELCSLYWSFVLYFELASYFGPASLPVTFAHCFHASSSFSQRFCGQCLASILITGAIFVPLHCIHSLSVESTIWSKWAFVCRQEHRLHSIQGWPYHGCPITLGTLLRSTRHRYHLLTCKTWFPAAWLEWDCYFCLSFVHFQAGCCGAH